MNKGSGGIFGMATEEGRENTDYNVDQAQNRSVAAERSRSSRYVLERKKKERGLGKGRNAVDWDFAVQ